MYTELPRLWSLAQTEAESFALPEDWQVGREPVDGVAVDPGPNPDREDPTELPDFDDALWIPQHETAQDQHVVTISVADVGAFVPPRSAIANHALFAGEARFTDVGTYAMLPRRVGQHALSLVETRVSPALTADIATNNEGEITPTLSSRFIQPPNVTYEDVAEYLRPDNNDPRAETFRALERMATNLFSARLNRAGIAQPNFGRKRIVGEGDLMVFAGADKVEVAKFIVRECMIAFNTGIGVYMRDREIPGIFRQQRIIRDGARFIIDKTWYSTEPGPHEAVQAPAYARGSAGLRRFDSLVNQWNIHAYRTGQDYPFTATELEIATAHLNRMRGSAPQHRGHRAYFEIRELIGSQRLYQEYETLTALNPDAFYNAVKAAVRESALPKAFQAALDTKISAQTLPARDLAVLLCAEHADESWVALKTSLLQYLAHGTNIGRGVLSIAEDKGLVDRVTAVSLRSRTESAWHIQIDRGEDSFSGEGRSPKRSDALHLASVRALAGLVGIPVAVVDTIGHGNPKRRRRRRR